MTVFNIKEHTHTRLNLLTGDRILVSPHRTKRPWQGKVESAVPDNRPVYDPACYLCPGNKRADQTMNPVYENPFAFTNDFGSLVKNTPAGEVNTGGLLQAKSESGICRVISFSPDHSLTLAQMSAAAIRKVIDLWCIEYSSITADPSIHYIQIFENKGDIMGCSNPHPHGQIWAQSSVPVEVNKESIQQKKYFDLHGNSLLGDYLQTEIEQQERIVAENDSFAVLVPFWATWPYETMIISKRQVTGILEFTETEKDHLADIIRKITTRYDNLFETSFPYSAGIHQAPVNEGEHPEWHWHIHFYPPLLRSATVKKFMVGYEMMANPQRDITPEWAAEQLKNQSELHYKLH